MSPPAITFSCYRRAAPVLVLALCWFQLFRQLCVEWSANEQYSYGWFVLPIASALFWRRWVVRPARSQSASGICLPIGSALILFLLCLLPLRIIEESNVGWRSAQWLHAIVLVCLSVVVIHWTKGWGWVKHFWFSVCFLLVAVPWPNRIESSVVQGLKRFVTGASVELVGIVGVPTFRRGNLIEIPSGVVSVDGACSGVRSLQTAIMAALMLGELYRLTPWRRVALIPAGFAIAIAANVARTSFLTWSAARQGFARMENWHGPAGIAVVFVVLGGLWLTAYLLSKRKDEGGNPKAEGQSQEQGAGSREQGFADHRQPTSGFRPPTSDLPHPTSAFQFSVFQRFSFSFQGPWSVVSGPFLAAAFGWLVFTEAFTVVWFHLGAKRAQTNPAWSINWPTNAVGYREIPLRKAELEMLRYDTARNTAWQDANGNQWSFIALHWGPKNKHSFIGRGHTPDECFVGGGWKLCGQPDPVRLCINGLDLPFRRYLFEFDGKTAYVFLALWDERSPGGKQELPLAYGIKRRLQAAWEGKRHQGLKKLEISIIGPSSSEEALQVLQKGLEELIIVEGEKAQTLKTEMLKPANTMAEG